MRKRDQWKIQLERKIKTITEIVLNVTPRNLELMVKKWGAMEEYGGRECLRSEYALENLLRYLCRR